MKEVKKWFLDHKRDLPWRENPSPYLVWVSEVMLQQTGVKVVIPYFQRWMREFPTLKDLANAPLEKVIKLWEGLGYYSRARALHKGAKKVLERFQGKVPDQRDLLESIPGIGPYTAGAILSFAYKKRALALDGNVMRVLSRYFCFRRDVTQAKEKRFLEEEGLKLLPRSEPWVVMEGLIELGALICKKKPLCPLCPLKEMCQGQSEAHLLPVKPKRVATTPLYRFVACIIVDGDVLIQKRGKKEVMRDLWELPYLEREKGERIQDVKRRFETLFNAPLVHETTLDEVTHGFTRFKAYLTPFVFSSTKKGDMDGEWVSLQAVDTLPFSSGHRRVMKGLQRALLDLFSSSK